MHPIANEHAAAAGSERRPMARSPAFGPATGYAHADVERRTQGSGGAGRVRGRDWAASATGWEGIPTRGSA